MNPIYLFYLNHFSTGYEPGFAAICRNRLSRYSSLIEPHLQQDSLKRSFHLTFDCNFSKSWLFRVGRLCLQPRRSSSGKSSVDRFGNGSLSFRLATKADPLEVIPQKRRSFHLTFDRNFPNSWVFHVGRFSLHPRRSSSGKVQSIGLVWRSTHSTHNFGTRSSYVHFM